VVTLAHDLARLQRQVSRLARPRPPVDPAELARYDWPRHARPNQLPPADPWTYWLMLTGRGWGKTRTGAEWVRQQVKTNRYVNLIGATSDDAREIMIEGESGLLEICPDNERPRYISNRRLLQWPNGARSLVFTADEPDRLRGKQHCKLWCDELASWRYPEAWDQAVFGLRLGDNPQAICTTTPRPRAFLKALIAHPACVTVRGNTHENRANLAPSFYDSIISKYEGTRLGRQEIAGELIDIPEGAWFQTFSEARHVKPIAYLPGVPIQLGIDVGTGRFCAAVIAQCIRINQDRVRFQILASYLSEGLFTEQNALAILGTVRQFPGAQILTCWLDPAASARTGIGPSALSEVERVFGERHVARSPQGPILDGLDQLELLLDHDDLIIHPRAETLISAIKCYVRARSGGEWRDAPASPQNPAEDSVDALRYLCRAVQPDRRPTIVHNWVSARKVF
jgi:Terminase large subunit, T4likevirus-type, N-terminal